MSKLATFGTILYTNGTKTLFITVRCGLRLKLLFKKSFEIFYGNGRGVNAFGLCPIKKTKNSVVRTQNIAMILDQQHLGNVKLIRWLRLRSK